MTSKREQVIEAVKAVCVGMATATVWRNRERPTKIPAEGLIIVRDGEMGDPEVLLSPVTYVWTHGVEIELATASGDRDGALDVMLADLSAALAAAPTLGGLVDYMQTSAPEIETESPEGASGVKAATVVVRLTYETADPLG